VNGERRLRVGLANRLPGVLGGLPPGVRQTPRVNVLYTCPMPAKAARDQQEVGHQGT
jgi:hypothetical protein